MNKFFVWVLSLLFCHSLWAKWDEQHNHDQHISVLQELKADLKHDPSPLKQQKVIDRLLQVGLYRQALDEIQLAKTEHAIIFELTLAEAKAYLGLQDYTQAREIISRLQTSSTSEWEQVSMLQAKIAFYSADFERAKNIYLDIVSHKISAPAILGLVKLSLHLEQLDEAKKYLQQLSQMDLPAKKHSKYLFYQAEYLRLSKNYSSASEYYQKALVQNVEPQALIGYASFLLEQRLYDEFNDCVLVLIKAYPYLPRVRYYNAIRLTHQDKISQATLLLNDLLSDFPDFVPGLLMLSRIYYESEQYPQAYTLINSLLQGKNTPLQAIKLAAKIRLKQNNPTAALHILRQDPSMIESDVSLMWLYQRALIQSVKNSESEYQAQQIIRPNQTVNPMLELAIGLESFSEQFPLESGFLNDLYALYQKDLSSLIHLTDEPLSAHDKTLAGLVAWQNGQYKDAKRYLEQAYAQDPQNPFILNNVASFYMQQKMFLKAQKKLDESRLVSQDNIRTMILSARLAQSQNRTNDAKAWLRKAVQSHEPLAGLYYLSYYARYQRSDLNHKLGEVAEHTEADQSFKQQLTNIRRALTLS